MFAVRKILVMLLAITVLISSLMFIASPAMASDGMTDIYPDEPGPPGPCPPNCPTPPLYIPPDPDAPGTGYHPAPPYKHPIYKKPYNPIYYPPAYRRYYPGYYPYNYPYNYPYYNSYNYANYPSYYPVTYWSFMVIAVVQNTSVTIRSYNFPGDVYFKVRMGYRQTNGSVYIRDIADLYSKSGGTGDYLLNIPADFKDITPLVIQLVQYTKYGQVLSAEQWFNNVTATVPAASIPPAPAYNNTTTPGYSYPTYSGYNYPTYYGYNYPTYLGNNYPTVPVYSGYYCYGCN